MYVCGCSCTFFLFPSPPFLFALILFWCALIFSLITLFPFSSLFLKRIFSSKSSSVLSSLFLFLLPVCLAHSRLPHVLRDHTHISYLISYIISHISYLTVHLRVSLLGKCGGKLRDSIEILARLKRQFLFPLPFFIFLLVIFWIRSQFLFLASSHLDSFVYLFSHSLSRFFLYLSISL